MTFFPVALGCMQSTIQPHATANPLGCQLAGIEVEVFWAVEAQE